MAKKEKQGNGKEKNLVRARGRIFKGIITKKFPTRVVVEFERTLYLPKYERYFKKKTKLHARMQKDMKLEIGDLVKIRECRPLSKIIHFIVIEKLNRAVKK
jgi:small subunit ribosomal protein S17